MKFRKKPVEIEAIQYLDDTHEVKSVGHPGWFYKACGNGTLFHSSSPDGTRRMFVKTLEGDMLVSDGDWIIKGVKGEIYPCKPDIFEMTYDRM